MRRLRCILGLAVFAFIVQSIIYIIKQTKPLTINKSAASANGILDTFQLPTEDLYPLVKAKAEQTQDQLLVKDAKVQKMINGIIEADSEFFPDWYWTATLRTLVRTLGKRRRDSGVVVVDATNNHTRWNTTAGWGDLDKIVRQYSLYDPDDPALHELLHRMTHSEIETIRANTKGWHLKVDVKFKGGGWAVLKPMRLPHHFKVKDKYGRHHAEIVAFHLDRLLGYYRVPPTVGRFVNLQTELYPLLPEGIRSTFFINEDGRMCYYGDCFKCNKNETYCGDPVIGEVSLMYYLPSTRQRKDLWNNWLFKDKRTNPDGVSESRLCNNTRVKYSMGNRLELEVLDVRYFDALSDNYDRHHYAAYTEFHNETIPLLYDNSEAFRKAASNNMINRATGPGSHCCLMKKSTFLKYLKLFLGPAHLSDLMRESLRADPVNIVFNEDQLEALDRRVNKTILFMHTCLKNARHIDDVIIDDDV